MGRTRRSWGEEGDEGGPATKVDRTQQDLPTAKKKAGSQKYSRTGVKNKAQDTKKKGWVNKNGLCSIS